MKQKIYVSEKARTMFKKVLAVFFSVVVSLLIGVATSNVVYADATSTPLEVPPLCQTTSTVVVSDTTNTVAGGGNAVATWVPPTTWINTLSDAIWIWSAVNVVDPTVDETHTFEKTFSLVGTTTDASIQIATDDTYKIFVNGIEIPGESDPNGYNWSALDTLTINPALFVVGENNIGIEVKNIGFEGGIPESNPAGVVYKLSVTGNICTPVPEPEPTPVVDVCSNIDGAQASVPEGKRLVGSECLPMIVRHGGGGIATPSTSGISVGPLITAGAGLILGVSTSTGESVAPECSTEYLNDYLRMGKKNNPEQVMKLQSFLNKHVGTNLPVTGYFGSMTFDAVQKFQLEHADQILTPWVPYGLESNTKPTGYVYKTTKRWINILECTSLNTPMPILP